MNGLYQSVDLPQTASPEQVVQQVFQRAEVTSYKILKIRGIHMPELYTAVLAQTNRGEKVVLIQYQAGG